MGRMLALLLVLACGGCTRVEHPIVAAAGFTLDPALVGAWEMTTAHNAELRELVLDCGAVIFSDDVLAEFRRVE